MTNKNNELTTMTVTVKKTLKQVLKIIAKDMKVSTNQLTEIVLAEFVKGVVDQARDNMLKQQAKQKEETVTEVPTNG